MRRATAFTALVLAVLAGAVWTYWALSPGAASSADGLACSVKPSCGVGEVALLRMSSTSSAHAGTPDGSIYGNVVCCGGVMGLGNSCSGVHDTVLTLSAEDNAHAASAGQYQTNVCLSADAETVDCWLGPSCGIRYACLGTVSATTNAHVADCDGTDDYATKVCCYVGDPIPVGGLAELPDVSDSSGSNYVALAGGIATALLALVAGTWYVRRRWFG